ncbi:MAG: GDYXXLXY domain-containing protein [Proteocatella sp.]
MKNKKQILMAIFGLLTIFAIILPGIKHELTLNLGETYKIKIQGYDPYDPVRGKYIQFSIDTSTIITDIMFEDTRSKVCYVTLKSSEDGYHTLEKAYLNKPKDNDIYLKTIIYKDYDDSYRYETPFNSYFISEDISSSAEKILMENIDNAYITVAFWNGNSTISGMYIDDKSIEDLAQKVK